MVKNGLCNDPERPVQSQKQGLSQPDKAAAHLYGLCGMFLITVLFLNAAKTKQELDSAVFQTAGIAQKFNCTLNRLDYMQEQGLMSSLPLANNLVPIKRACRTAAGNRRRTGSFIPVCRLGRHSAGI